MAKKKRVFKEYSEIRAYTSIDLTSKSANEIMEYVESKRNDESYSEIGFPIREGVLISRIQFDEKIKLFDNALLYYYFKIEYIEDKISILIETYGQSEILGDKVFIGESAFQVELNSNESFDETKVQPLLYSDRKPSKNHFLTINKLRMKKATTEGAYLNDLAFVLNALLYINIVREERDVIYRKAKGITFKSQTKTTKPVKPTKTQKVEVLNGDKVMYVISGKEDVIKGFRVYNRKTDSWNVIGHWRHYKSGLKKWIEGYKKGKGVAKAKHYKVQ